MVLRKTLFFIFSKVPIGRPRPVQWLALSVFFFSLLQTYSIDEVDFRGMRSLSLVVTAKSMSPAMYAFEDVNLSWSHVELSQTPSIELKAGEALNLHNMPASVRDHFLLKKSYRLKGITLKRFRKKSVPTNISPNINGRSRLQAQESVTTNQTVRLAKGTSRYQLSQLSSNQLNSNQLSSNQLSSLRSQNATGSNRYQSGMSLKQKLDQLVKKELQERQLFAAAQAGSPIYLQTQDKAKVGLLAANQKRAAKSTVAAKRVITPVKKENTFFFSQKSRQGVQVLLSGSLQMRDGLGFTGVNDSLVVYHVDGGEVLAEGEIDLELGKFEIEVNGLSGYLVAELRNEKEELVGYAESSMFDFRQVKNKNTYTSYDLHLKPVEDGIITRVVSAKSFDNHKILVSEAQLAVGSLDSKGMHRTSEVIKGSTMMVKAYAEGHWNALGVSRYGTYNELRLFPKSLMQAFASIVYDENENDIKNSAVLWGRVLKAGRPVAGAVVELAGQEDIRATYFSSYIPDVHRNKTSEDGYFAFAKLTSGIQAVRAIYNGEVFPAEVVPTEKNTVTYVELKGAQKRKISVNTSDPFDLNAEVESNVSIIGFDESHRTSSTESSVLNVPIGESSLFLESDAGEPFVQTRHAIQPGTQHFDMKLIKQEWLYSLLQRRRINLDPDTGVVVGFIKGDNYRVEIDSQSPKSMVYFNEKGQLTNAPVSGGGFVAFNVKYGVRNLSIYARGSRRRYNEMILPDYNIVNVVGTELEPLR